MSKSMMAFTFAFLGSVGFFLAYACLQAVVAGKSTRSIYLAYSAYLLFILLYFVVHAYFRHLYIGQQLEAPLFSGIVISYLLFAKALFRNRESYQYFSGIANSGIYTIWWRCYAFPSPLPDGNRAWRPFW